MALGSIGSGGRVQHMQSRRITGFSTSIFAEMSALAQRYQAINLGQGFPDFPGPTFIPSPGLPHLFQHSLACGSAQSHLAVPERLMK